MCIVIKSDKPFPSVEKSGKTPVKFPPVSTDKVYDRLYVVGPASMSLNEVPTDYNWEPEKVCSV